MEVGAPVNGIVLALAALALTPRSVNLYAGFWARGSFPVAALLVYADNVVRCSGRTISGVFYP